jgi:hypothetical protein
MGNRWIEGMYETVVAVLIAAAIGIGLMNLANHLNQANAVVSAALRPAPSQSPISDFN